MQSHDITADSNQEPAPTPTTTPVHIPTPQQPAPLAQAAEPHQETHPAKSSLPPCSSSSGQNGQQSAPQLINIATTNASQPQNFNLSDSPDQQIQQNQNQQCDYNMNIQQQQRVPITLADLPSEVLPDIAAFCAALFLQSPLAGMDVSNIRDQGAVLQLFEEYNTIVAAASEQFYNWSFGSNLPNEQLSFLLRQLSPKQHLVPNDQMPTSSSTWLLMNVYETQLCQFHKALRTQSLLAHQNSPSLNTPDSVVPSSSLKKDTMDTMSHLTQNSPSTSRTPPVESGSNDPSTLKKDEFAGNTVSLPLSSDMLRKIEAIVETAKAIKRNYEENHLGISDSSSLSLESGEKPTYDGTPSPASGIVESDNEVMQPTPQVSLRASPLWTHQNTATPDSPEPALSSSSSDKDERESMSIPTQVLNDTVEWDSCDPSPPNKQQYKKDQSTSSGSSSHGAEEGETHETTPSPAFALDNPGNENKKRSMAVDIGTFVDQSQLDKKKAKLVPEVNESKKDEPTLMEQDEPVMVREEVVVSQKKKGRPTKEKMEQEEDEDDTDPKNQCGLAKGCKLPKSLINVHWVGCDDCLQWYHTYCKFGKNHAFQEANFSCCKKADDPETTEKKPAHVRH